MLLGVVKKGDEVLNVQMNLQQSKERMVKQTLFQLYKDEGGKYNER